MKYLIICATLLALANQAQAQPMYCGHKRVIRLGFSTGQVETFCGSPDEITGYGYGTEEWIYYGRPITNDSYRAATPTFYLIFENGRLISIERG